MVKQRGSRAPRARKQRGRLRGPAAGCRKLSASCRFSGKAGKSTAMTYFESRRAKTHAFELAIGCFRFRIIHNYVRLVDFVPKLAGTDLKGVDIPQNVVVNWNCYDISWWRRHATGA